uniref:Uncharacterized protein LOC111134190 n=1 Tax=Crassostrea virginica TaxID=6565 RepID=A0A8B8EGH2_CRAVI|nr:uncharacterized protein LOC111134190 [Crassostrea virginica]
MTADNVSSFDSIFLIGKEMMFLMTLLASACVLISCQTKFTPMTNVYYNETRNWNEAKQTCAQTGGSLAQFLDISTVMDILEDLPQMKNITVWNAKANTAPTDPSSENCSTITLRANMTVSTTHCLQDQPFMCQYSKGECRYKIYEQTSIRGNNIFTKTAITWQHCHDLCETVTEITCRSFEYNPVSQYCQLSDTNRWREKNQFAYYVKSWDYYHKTCVTALSQQEYQEFASTTPSQPTTSLPVSTVSMETSTSKIQEKSEWPKPLRVLVFDIPLTWTKAGEFCHSKGGSLLILDDKSIIPETNVTSSKTLNTLWIGLSKEENEEWKWIDGEQPSGSHWKYEPNQYDTSQKCASVTLQHPYWWYEGFCSEPKPFICQFREETCRYQKEVESVIVAHNKLVLVNYSLAECYHICNSSTEVTCRSFEYNVENKTCQIIEVNKWTESDYFLKDVTGWDYYHRKCYFGSDDFIEPTTKVKSTTTVGTTEMSTNPSTEMYTTTEKAFEEMQRELKEMGQKIREKNRKASKTSAIDTRPSATSVGVVAIVIIVSMVGGVVLLDMGTLHLHCQQLSGRSKKKKAKYRYIERHETSTDCDNLAYVSENLDRVRCETRSSNDGGEGVEQDNGKLNTEENSVVDSKEVMLMTDTKNNNVENTYDKSETKL